MAVSPCYAGSTSLWHPASTWRWPARNGKTTLVKTLMGLLPASAGTILFDGEDITKWPAHRRSRAGIAYVPQGRDLFPALSVRDNLRMGCRSGSEGDAAIDRVIALFPMIGDLLGRASGTLSSDEQQIVATARAICATPRLLLLDEPSEGVQPSMVAEPNIRCRGSRKRACHAPRQYQTRAPLACPCQARHVARVARRQSLSATHQTFHKRMDVVWC